MKKAAIFDQDGTLFDTESIWQKQWHLAAQRRNIQLPADFAQMVCGKTKAGTSIVLAQLFHTDHPEKIYEEVERIVHQIEAEHIDMKPGVLEIVQYFFDHHVPMAIASSSPLENIEHNIKQSNIEKYFSVLVTGRAVQNSKPAPDIFLLAGKKLGVDIRDCYVFEDAFNGVEAGAAAGAKTIMIPDQIQPDKRMKEIASIYPSFHEVLEDIQKGTL